MAAVKKMSRLQCVKPISPSLQMYFHILSKMRMVYWVYRDVMCAGYPLKDIDSIAPDGMTNQKSVMCQVVYGVSTCRYPANILRHNDVVITSKRCHFDVITSKRRRF